MLLIPVKHHEVAQVFMVRDFVLAGRVNVSGSGIDLAYDVWVPCSLYDDENYVFPRVPVLLDALTPKVKKACSGNPNVDGDVFELIYRDTDFAAGTEIGEEVMCGEDYWPERLFSEEIILCKEGLYIP